MIKNLQIKSYQIYSLMRILPILCLLITFQAASSINCSASHFDFTSRYTLGKQDELNKTFEKIQEKITSLQEVTYKTTDGATYRIYNANPSFYYRDSKQKAVLRGNDTIVIDGGYLEVDFTFNWSKNNVSTREGTGSVSGLSFQLIIAKKLVVDNGFYSFELLDSMPVTFNDDGSTFKFTRIDPPDVSDADLKNLLKMINNVEENKDVRTELENEIARYYSYYLRASLHDEHMAIDVQFDYNWVPTAKGKNNVTISLVRRPITVDIEKQGIQSSFDIQVENDTKWKCGNRNVPISPFDPKTYGGAQQFVSYDFYEGMLRYAIDKDILDSQLARENWESRMFQFYTGDLYEIFPLVQDKFYASTEVNGTCEATFDNLKVSNAGKDTLNVSLHFDCSLFIQKEKIVDMGIDLTLTVGGFPNTSSIDYRLISHDQTVKFYPYDKYKIVNEELATSMVRSSLNRLYQGNLFGSGFPLSPPRDYPVFSAEGNFTVVYDASHIS